MSNSMTEATPEDIDCFNKYGYVVVKNAFSRVTAELCREKMWDHIKITNGVDRHDQSTWIPKVRSDKIWHRKDGAPWANVFTEKLQNAIDSLIGPNQAVEAFGAGWWTITFPGFSELPWGVDGNWHVDGNGYQHYPFSKEVGIIPMMLFSDVLPGGGGTAIAEGSHLVASQILADVGLRGCSAKELSLTVLQSGIDFDITEITGEAGDVILLHPFLLHSRSKNLMPTAEEGVRFLCHPSIPLKSHMDFTRPCGDLSVLEASIVRAVAGDGEEEQKNQPLMKHEENSPNMTKINVSYEKTGSSTDNDEYPSEKDRLYRKWEENENEDKGNINPENPESDCHLKISDKRCTSASSSSSSSDSSGGKNSKYSERRRLLSCISPEACREFALRRKANKNRNGNRFNAGDDEEEKYEEVEEKGIRELENKQFLENTQGCSFNEDNILGISPDYTINNCTSLESNISVVSTEHYSDTNVVSTMKNSNVDTKKRKREINLLSDSSEDLIESVMGFGNFKTSYRR